MFEFIGALGLAAFVGWLIGHFSGSAIDRAVGAFRELVGGFQRGEVWPRGVQEEDRDMPWGASVAKAMVKPVINALIVPTRTAVGTGRIKPKTRAR